MFRNVGVPELIVLLFFVLAFFAVIAGAVYLGVRLARKR